MEDAEAQLAWWEQLTFDPTSSLTAQAVPQVAPSHHISRYSGSKAPVLPAGLAVSKVLLSVQGIVLGVLAAEGNGPAKIAFAAAALVTVALAVGVGGVIKWRLRLCVEATLLATAGIALHGSGLWMGLALTGLVILPVWIIAALGQQSSIRFARGQSLGGE